MRAVWFALSVAALSQLSPVESASVVHEKRRVLGVPVHVVTANLNDPRVKVSSLLAAGFPHGEESFTSLVRRAGAAAVVTGGFFSTDTRLPIGDVVIGGVLKHFGGFGTALAITAGNEVGFHQVPTGRHVDWSPYESVISCGPRLMRGGRIALAPRHEGFRDPRVLGRAARVAVGFTPNRKLVFVVTGRSLTLSELAKIMRRLGCIEAMNLDGGSSTALGFRGKTLVSPGRRLVQVITVFDNWKPTPAPLLLTSAGALKSTARTRPAQPATWSAAALWAAATCYVENVPHTRRALPSEGLLPPVPALPSRAYALAEPRELKQRRRDDPEEAEAAVEPETVVAKA